VLGRAGVIRGQVLCASSGIAFLSGEQLPVPMASSAWGRGTVTIVNSTTILVSLTLYVPDTDVSAVLLSESE